MPFELEPCMDLLARTPEVLRGMLSDLPDAWTRADEGPDTWSAYDVVGHLVDGEESDWMARVLVILDPGDDRRFAPFDRFRHLRRGAETLGARLERFALLRDRNLLALEALCLTDQQLARTAEHPAFGTVTLAQLLSTWVVHDLGHVAQVSRVLAARHRVEVGPWRAYLPVLERRAAR